MPFDLTELIQYIGYPGLFAIIFAESGTVIGFILPGSSLLFTSGFLASQGILDIRIIVPLVGLAAVLGDNVGYWFGAKIGIRLFERPNSRFFKREYLERTRRFYARYGTRTILFARFVPIVRTFAPILAGIVNMNYREFMIYNLIGGIMWASGISYAGYLLGETVPRSAEYIEIVILTIIVVTCIPLVREFWKQRRMPRTLPHATVFDLDSTLAITNQQPSANMLSRLAKLSTRMPIAILSGAHFDRIERDVLALLPALTRKERFFVLSQNGAQCYEWKNDVWMQVYDHTLSETETDTIISALLKTIEKTKFMNETPQDGRHILNRGGFITFTGAGIDMKESEKEAWDPTLLKRQPFIHELRKLLPGYDIYIGGKTSIDIMQKGVNKAYGIRWLLKHLNLQPKDMLFIGDALYPGGNDAPVLETGVETKQVENPQDTAVIIDKMLGA